MISHEAENIKKSLLKIKNMEEVLNTPLEIQRKAWEDSASADIMPDGVFIKESIIENISTEWISTNNSNNDNVILYFHGGGLNQGSIITHRKLAAHIAKIANLSVLIFDYHLSPENPYPSALNCSEQVYLYLLRSGFKPENIIFGGDSAGGGLSLALALLLKTKHILLPKGIFLMSPMLDFTLSGSTIKTCADKDPLLFIEDLRLTVNHYIGNESPCNPLISPIHGNIKGFPTLLVQVGSDELLLSDSTRFADKARESRVDVQLSVWEGMWHVFQAWVDEIPEATNAIEEIGQFTKTLLS